MYVRRLHLAGQLRHKYLLLLESQMRQFPWLSDLFSTEFFFRKMRVFDWLYTTLVQCRKWNKKLSNIVKEWTKLQNDTRWKLISHKSIKENMVGPSQRKKNFLWGAATKLWSYSACFLVALEQKDTKHIILKNKTKKHSV